MPRASRRCPGDDYDCPNLIKAGQQYCPNHTVTWRGERTASSRITTKWSWRRLRTDILERAGYQCKIKYPGICTGKATTVDKIIPAARRPDLARQRWNLRAACKPCNEHKARTIDRHV